jgi:hypothetical protein
MLLRRAVVAFCVGVMLVAFSRPCWAQGAATVTEMRAAGLAAEWIGTSLVVRQVIESVLGRGSVEAERMLALPPQQLGWRVIESDRLAGALATAPSIARAGHTEELLASINSLRAFSATAKVLSSAGAQSNAASLRLLGVQKSTSAQLDEIIRAATVAQKVSPATTGPTSRSFSIGREGIKADPGFEIPVWKSDRATVKLQLDTLKWSDAAKGGAVVCALVSPCAENVSKRVKAILGTSKPSND